MLRLTGCPRCRGFMLLGQDVYGRYRQCLQCGHLEDLDVTGPAASNLAAGALQRKEVA